MTMKAIFLDEESVRRIANGSQKAVILPVDLKVDKDYWIVSKDSEIAPGSIYPYKCIEVGEQLFESLLDFLVSVTR